MGLEPDVENICLGYISSFLELFERKVIQGGESVVPIVLHALLYVCLIESQLLDFLHDHGVNRDHVEAENDPPLDIEKPRIERKSAVLLYLLKTSPFFGIGVEDFGNEVPETAGQ